MTIDTTTIGKRQAKRYAYAYICLVTRLLIENGEFEKIYLPAMLFGKELSPDDVDLIKGMVDEIRSPMMHKAYGHLTKGLHDNEPKGS